MKAPLGKLAIVSLIVIVLLTSCGMEQPTQSSNLDYKEVKTMVVDILKTEEAQKAIQSGPSGGGGGGLQAQSLTMQQQEQLRTAVKDTLVSPEYEKVLDKVMKDPKFAGEFAKAVSKENKQILKALMKDPEYQKDFGDIVKSPDMMKSYLDMVKTPEYRKQLQTVMKDAMNSPLFKLEVMDLLGKVVKEELQPKEKGKEGQKKGGEKQGGGESGGSEEEGGSSEG
ncbi:spore germination lipoprotein GerD [Paenibacillus alvei]|uniref:spore germination lipoprotein GerD n=1 Tax=Paenibacillus alvei TaxID=44250 RepID=UPI0018CCA4CC|nr:spore germination lipoprotein GerD [Paenibacillus alvei]MBG9734228.1 spore gernimation protein [Paenibacillus alvei]MBG9744059.1 spore gernimation protein [Paenibacillus alvei]MCY9580865.1 spore germination lipoprotein GerD [Paenibacillus alvei]MCY9587510.1 spore germination lipoprotein GerD [Paenibacillus alvei]